MRSRSSSSLLAVFAVLAASCGGAAKHPAGPFDYGPGAPLAVRDAGLVARGSASVHDVSYLGADGRRIRAFLVLPRSSGRHPAVVFLHGSGGSRVDLLVTAARLALRGAVAMTLSLPPARTYRPVVIDVRRALDVLDERPDVDPHRLGVVGYSLGAQLAAIVAGVDGRPRAVGVIAGRGTDDARQYVARTKADLFFQAALRDALVPPDQLEALIDAAPGRPRVRWYETGHGMSDRVFADQDDWQARELGLTR
jgi:dienelactone hydrolase